jgi:hypothetical protein
MYVTPRGDKRKRPAEDAAEDFWMEQHSWGDYPWDKPTLENFVDVRMQRKQARVNHFEQQRETHQAVNKGLWSIPNDVIETIKGMANIPMLPRPRVLFHPTK